MKNINKKNNNKADIKLQELIEATFSLSYPNEIWKEIQSKDIAENKKEITVREALQGLYYISNFGRVLSIYQKKPRILKQNSHKGRYNRVQIDKKNLFIHRIVADYFIGDILGKDIHHINGNPLDNRAENLQVLTKQEHKNKHKKGEKNVSS